MSKFKAGDVIERYFLGTNITYEVVCLEGGSYTLKGRFGEFKYREQYINLCYKLKTLSEIVNV